MLYSKRSSFLSCLLLTIGCLSSETAVQAQISPENTIIVFDLDDVLIGIKTSKKVKFGLYLLVRPDAWGDMRKIAKHSSHAEKLIKKNKKPGFVKRLKRIKQSKKPVDGMLELLQELKQKGYTLHIASNMSQQDFEFYKNQYSEIFSLFDAAFVIEDDNMPQKPSKRYFDLYRATFPTEKHHFFIDDKKENCDASGFSYTHIFKNAQSLHSDFKTRGIL